MSAFVVSQETINCVVSVPAEALSGWINPPQLNRFGRDIWALNAEAVAQRYSEPAEALPRFTYRPHEYTRIQQYKALRCLIYQCSEGNVPETPLYKMLVDIADALALFIVGRSDVSIKQAREIINRMPEYDKAEWCLRDIGEIMAAN